MRLQRTLKKELLFKGLGLHTGTRVEMRLKPAPRNNGIIFYRSDKGEYVPASINAISDTAFATTLGANGTKVRTVEHILAALSGLGIDNAVIDVSGPEVPILDGSSLGFVEEIMEAGIAKQGSNRSYLVVTKPVAFKEGNSEIIAFPHDGRTITYQIDYNHALLGRQSMSMDIDEDNFVNELAPARTFGFLKDVQKLKSMGLAKGGSLDNAVVIGEHGVMNESGLRFDDEFIRHKILDFIGDMSLCGFPIHGHFVVNRSGHTSNMKFFKKFLASTDCWRMVTEVEEPLQAIA